MITCTAAHFRTQVYDRLFESTTIKVFAEATGEAPNVYVTASATLDTETETTTVTFSATAEYKNYLDLQGGTPEYTVRYSFTCSEETVPTEEQFTLKISDTNNQPPVFADVQPDIAVFLNTWNHDTPLLTFKVSDGDYSADNAKVTLEVSGDGESAVVLTALDEGVGDRPKIFTYTLKLATDVTPGNYAIRLTASDGVSTVPSDVALAVTQSACIPPAIKENEVTDDVAENGELG